MEIYGCLPANGPLTLCGQRSLVLTFVLHLQHNIQAGQQYSFLHYYRLRIFKHYDTISLKFIEKIKNTKNTYKNPCRPKYSENIDFERFQSNKTTFDIVPSSCDGSAWAEWDYVTG